MNTQELHTLAWKELEKLPMKGVKYSSWLTIEVYTEARGGVYPSNTAAKTELERISGATLSKTMRDILGKYAKELD